MVLRQTCKTVAQLFARKDRLFFGAPTSTGIGGCSSLLTREASVGRKVLLSMESSIDMCPEPG